MQLFIINFGSNGYINIINVNGLLSMCKHCKHTYQNKCQGHPTYVFDCTAVIAIHYVKATNICCYGNVQKTCKAITKQCCYNTARSRSRS